MYKHSLKNTTNIDYGDKDGMNFTRKIILSSIWEAVL